jgi:hypothetical protein
MAAIGNSPTQQAFTPAIDYFSGNGSTTAFTLSRPVASVAQVQVTIDNVAQNPSSAYTVSSNTITFTSAPLSGTNNIYVYYTSPITQVIAPGQGTVVSSSFGTITDFTTTGNTVLGDATTDILTVGVTGIVKDASGNVGIGTASPIVNLDVNSSAAGGNICAFRSTATNGGYVQFQGSGSTPTTSGYVGAASKLNTGGSVTDFGMTARTNLVFGTNDGTERMRISSAGLVGINEVAPATLLHMTNGTLRIDGTTAQAIYIRGAATIKPYISMNEFGTRQWDIGAGYYSAGTFSIQSNQVNGVYLGGTATAWASASDERIKDIIEPISNALTKVNGLRSVIGKYKTDEEGVRRSFLIAQDIQTQFPEALESSDSERLGVQYTDVIPLLVASIKELKAINDTQAETINALTARIEVLEGR